MIVDQKTTNESPVTCIKVIASSTYDKDRPSNVIDSRCSEKIATLFTSGACNEEQLLLCDEDKNITQYVKVEFPTNCPIAPPPSDTVVYHSIIGGHTIVII